MFIKPSGVSVVLAPPGLLRNYFCSFYSNIISQKWNVLITLKLNYLGQVSTNHKIDTQPICYNSVFRIVVLNCLMM